MRILQAFSEASSKGQMPSLLSLVTIGHHFTDYKTSVHECTWKKDGKLWTRNVWNSWRR